MKAIFQSTIKEMLRKRTFVVMTIVTVLYLLFWGVLLYHFTGSHDIMEQMETLASSMILQTGLQFSSMLICLLTIILGAGVIASELENGLVLGIISRPIGRASYVLGKFSGVLLLTTIYGTALYSLVIGIGAAFSLSTVAGLSFTQLWQGWLLYIAVPAAVLCPTTFGSVSIKSVPNGLLMIFLYILGNIGGMVQMIGELIDNAGVLNGGIFLSLVSPFHTLYSTAERVLIPSTGIAGEMMRGLGGLSGSGSAPGPWMYVYIAVYCVLFLALALRKFSRTDINL